MSNLGLLGAMQGGGNAIAETGKLMMGDHLETLRQERLAEVQAKRDERLFGQSKEMADIQQEDKKEIVEDSQAHEKGLLDEKQGFTGGENEKDRDLKRELARFEVEAKTKLEAIKNSQSSQSGADKKYVNSITRWHQNHPDKEMSKRTLATLYSEAFGIGERLLNQSTNEVTMVSMTEEGDLGVTAEYVRPEGGSRRDREFRTVDPQKKPDAPLDLPGYTQTKIDVSKYPDNNYKLKDGRILVVKDGIGYIKN